MATVMVQNRVAIAQGSLPEAVIQQGVTTQKQSTNIVLFLSLEGDSTNRYNSLYLSNYANLNIVDALSRIEGVGGVNVFGAGNYSMRIWLNPETMRIRGITPSDVYEAIHVIQEEMGVTGTTAKEASSTFSGSFDSMKAAASNPNGAMMGFMGMNMAQNAGGFNAAQLYQMGQQQNTAPVQAAPAAPTANTWKCICGTENTGKFCVECGSKKPETGWVCACGSVNKGKFCPECGAKKPAGIPQYRCDKCGWQPEDPTKAPRFCPECGDPFDNGDIV